MKTEIAIKQRLFDFCSEFIDQRLNTIQNQIEDIQESLNSETKSSAGDKHETGRAMLQLEREKSGQQLAEIQTVKSRLNKIDVSKKYEIVSVGSAVLTTQANYFIAISAGAVTIGTTSFFAIASNTPIGMLLMGKSKGTLVEFRGKSFTITDVF